MKLDQSLLMTTVVNKDIIYSTLVKEILRMYTHCHSFISMYIQTHFEANCISIASYCEQ